MDFKKINIKKVKKISSWLILGFLLVVLIFVLIPFLPIKNNYSLKMVTSGSMRPTIKTGAIVMIKPTLLYKVGDIITFKVGSGKRDIVTHRIISRKGDEFTTQGDANNIADTKPVKNEQIIGKVIFNIPYAGYAANSAHSKFGFILLILIPAILIIMEEIKNISSEKKKLSKNKTAEGSKGRRFLVLILIASLGIGLISTSNSSNLTHAYFSDSATSTNHSFQTGTLNITLRSGQNNFVSGAENMQPGQQVNRDIYVGKTADSFSLKHRVSYKFISGDKQLCNQLNLKIWYDHYHGNPSGGYANRDMRLRYDGPLISLANLTDVNFLIPHPDDQFDIDDSNGTEQWFYYSLTLPQNINNSLEGKTCQFEFVFDAWQANMAHYEDGGFTDEEKMESIIKTGSWAPVLNSMVNQVGAEGQTLSFPINATDPNGDPLTYSASNLPTGATINPDTGIFSWTPSIGQTGTYSVLFEVSDDDGYTNSENITITIAEIPSPEISDVQATNIGTTSADITWQTNEPATSKVEYGTTIDYGLVLKNPDPVETHSISISGLTSNTVYHYRVSSKNSAGKEKVSVDYNFTTKE